jgi:hypothetical protein
MRRTRAAAGDDRATALGNGYRAKPQSGGGRDSKGCGDVRLGASDPVLGGLKARDPTGLEMAKPGDLARALRAKQ